MPADTLLLVQMSLLLLTIGAVGGFLSGLLGVGGGILFVPALVFCLSAMGLDDKHAMQVAVGSSLTIICITGATSAFAHWRRGSVDMTQVKMWAVPLIAGVGLGALFAGMVDGYILRFLFACITVLICGYMFFAPKPKNPESCLIVPVRIQKAVMGLIGVISSLIGVGGAVMTVPFMHMMGFTMQRAAGTGAILGLLIAVPGSITYMVTGMFHLDELPPWSLGYVNGMVVGLIIPASILTAPLGVQASYSLSREMLRRVFGVVLLIVSLRMFMTL